METEVHSSGAQGQGSGVDFLKNQNHNNPIIKILLQLHADLVRAESDTEKLFVSDYVDKYINIGLNWGIPGIQDDSEAQKILNAVHDYAMSIRKQAFPKYDGQFLEKYLYILKIAPMEPSEKQRIQNLLKQAREALDSPEKIGLIADPGFQTCHQKVFYLLSQIKEISARHRLFTLTWFPNIMDEAKHCIEG